MSFYHLILQSLADSDVQGIASSVELHPSLRELTVRGCSESLAKGAVKGVGSRHDVEKLHVIPYWKSEYL